MESYTSCPNCGAEADGSGGSSWFDVYECGECGGVYCYVCGGNDGTECPHTDDDGETCGSSDYTTIGQVYLEEDGE